MKVVISIILGSLLCMNAIAQSSSTDAEVIKTKKSFLTPNTTFKKPSKDYVMLQAGYNKWILTDSADKVINLKDRGHELAAYICYDFPLSKQGVSFALGAGISSSNIYLKNQRLPLNDTNYFVKFKDLGDSQKNIRYKMSSNFIEFPFEFRYFGNPVNRNKGFKASLGIKIGTLVNFHTKETYTYAGVKVRDKESARRYHQQWRITPTARIGWGNFSIYANYQLSDVFKTGNQQGIRPFGVGICLSGM